MAEQVRADIREFNKNSGAAITIWCDRINKPGRCRPI